MQGTSTIKMKDSVGNVTNEMKSNITIYMKQPNLIKIILDSPVKSIIVQKDNLLKMKIEGSNQILTQKVSDSNDLFKQYYQQGTDEIIENTLVEKSELVQILGKKLYKFRIRYAQGATTQTINNVKLPFTADYYDMYFDEAGRLVKNIIFSHGKEMVHADMEYINRNGIFVMNKISSTSTVENMVLESIVEYTMLSVNTLIQDKEFEL
jgi:outer membrane lipoprotein-sorting protein